MRAIKIVSLLLCILAIHVFAAEEGPNLSSYSNKARAALHKATSEAKSKGAAAVTPLHMAAALFADVEGLPRRIVDKAGCDVDQVGGTHYLMDHWLFLVKYL